MCGRQGRLGGAYRTRRQWDANGQRATEVTAVDTAHTGQRTDWSVENPQRDLTLSPSISCLSLYSLFKVSCNKSNNHYWRQGRHEL